MVFCYSSWNRLKSRTKYEVPGTVIADSGRKRNVVGIGTSVIEDGHLKHSSQEGENASLFSYKLQGLVSVLLTDSE